MLFLVYLLLTLNITISYYFFVCSLQTSIFCLKIGYIVISTIATFVNAAAIMTMFMIMSMIMIMTCYEIKQ